MFLKLLRRRLKPGYIRCVRCGTPVLEKSPQWQVWHRCRACVLWALYGNHG